MNKELQELFDGLVTKETLSQSALEKLKSVVEENAELEKQVENLQSDAEVKASDYRDLKNECDALEVSNEALLNREGSLKARENDCHKTEIQQAADRATAAAYKEAFGLVFRNTTVRNSVLETVSRPNEYPYTDHNGIVIQKDYNNPVQTTDTKDTTSTEE